MFANITNEQYAYWLGFIYADGCISKNQLIVELSSKDKSHLAKLQDFIGVGRIVDKPVSCRYTFNHKESVDNLIALGIVPRKTYENNSFVFDNVPDDLKHHFIRGFFDGDGSVWLYKNKYNFGFTSLNKKLLTILCEWINIHSSCTICLYAYTKQNRVVNYLSSGGNGNAFYFREFLYSQSSIYLERKKHIFDRLSRSCVLDSNDLNCIKMSNQANSQLSKIYNVSADTIRRIKLGLKSDIMYKYNVI